MLVHKRTCGVLDCFWTGRNVETKRSRCEPVMKEYTFENSGLDPAEWWYVKRGSSLGIIILKTYPYFTPRVDSNGDLAGITVWKSRECSDESQEENNREVAEGNQGEIPMKNPKKKRIGNLCMRRGLLETLFEE